MRSSGEVVAEFDPKIQVYLVVQVLVVLGATLAGVLLWPVWLIVGPLWASYYFPTIEARLGARSLVYQHGVWFRQEMSIPLDKIQDVSLHHGPILDALGLATLKVETAGGGQQGSSATLIGVRNAAAFRAKIIARRDALTLPPPPAQAASSDSSDALLREIRDSLHRIEALLQQRG